MLLQQCRLPKFLRFAGAQLTLVEDKSLLEFCTSETYEDVKSQARGSHTVLQVASAAG